MNKTGENMSINNKQRNRNRASKWGEMGVLTWSGGSQVKETGEGKVVRESRIGHGGSGKGEPGSGIGEAGSGKRDQGSGIRDAGTGTS